MTMSKKINAEMQSSAEVLLLSSKKITQKYQGNLSYPIYYFKIFSVFLCVFCASALSLFDCGKEPISGISINFRLTCLNVDLRQKPTQNNIDPF